MTRFIHIDRVLQLEVGQRIVAVKGLSLAESYLQDHFPLFPVMPGVMMLESMYQAAAWLVRVTEDFRHSMVLLKEAKNVKFADFVEPGDQLRVTCEWFREAERFVTVKAQGEIGDRIAVKSRLTLERYNLSEEQPERRPVDQYMIRQFQQQFGIICPQWNTAGAQPN